MNTPKDFALSVFASYAVRYSLPRESMAGYEVQDLIYDQIESIQTSDVVCMIRDITKALDENRAGDSRIDHPDWKRLRDFLVDELAKRDAVCNATKTS